VSATPAPSLCPDSPLADAARQLLDELDQLFLTRRQNQAQIAKALARAQRLELHKACGYASLSALAWDRYQWGRSKTSESLAIVKACQELPKTRAAFEAGSLEWTKAREVTKIATPQDEDLWLERSKTWSVEELRAARKGEAAKVQRVLSFTPEQAARFDQALAGVRDGLDLAEAGLAVLAALEGGLGGALGERATTRVVISECGSCRVATTESREGAVVVAEGAVEAARCSGEVHDLREDQNVVRRAIPAAVRRRVLDRDRRRCQVPRCESMAFLEVHHAEGWKAGHDPKRLLVLCGAHHRQCHEGWLLIEGEAPEFRFRGRVDVGRGQDGGGAVFAYENTGGSGSESAAQKGVGEERAREVVEVVELALGRLGMGARERREKLKRAMERGGQRAWSEAELVVAVLSAA